MKKLFSLVLLIMMCFVMSVPTFASDVETQNSSEENFTLADAAEILGVDVEELAGMKIQRLPSLGYSNGNVATQTTITPIAEKMQSECIYYEDITITSSFTGAMHYMMGKKYMWAVGVMDWHGNGQVGVQRWYGDNSYPDQVHMLDNSNKRFDSGWVERPYGTGLYFEYYLVNQYVPGTKTIRMVIAVY